jgi:hypothetical protein
LSPKRIFSRIFPCGRENAAGVHGGLFDMMIVPEAANMPPTPWQTEILAPGIWAGAWDANWLVILRRGTIG